VTHRVCPEVKTSCATWTPDDLSLRARHGSFDQLLLS
jgi:hypothetical protein